VASVQLISKPRDAGRLQAVYRDLAEKALSPEYLVAEPAAHALSFAGDVEAVPFLAAIARNKFFDAVAIEGLARIGDVSSVNAIETVMRDSTDPFMPAIASSKLQELRNRTTSVSVLSEIDRVIAGAATLQGAPSLPAR